MSKRIKMTRKRRTSGKLVVINEEELIRQVSMRPELYDRSLKAYRKSSLRQIYWKEVSNAMDATVEECRRRWRSLRDSFGKHYKQIQKSTDVVGLNKHRKWIFYEQMSFMIPYLENPSYELDEQLLDMFDDNSDETPSLDAIANGNNNSEIEQNPEDRTLSQDINQEPSYQQQHSQQNQSVAVSVQATTDFMQMPEIDRSTTPNPTQTENSQRRTYNQSSATLSVQCAETNTDGYFLDADEKFLLSCAPCLKRLTNRQNALARLKIQQILFDIEFGEENK